MSGGEVEGVLITGVYGADKSSIAEEIADALEARGARFGALTSTGSCGWRCEWFALSYLASKSTTV